MRKLLITAAFMLSAHLHAQHLQHGLVGFATVPTYGCEDTSGGALGELVTANNEDELRHYCKAKEPYTILFEGHICRNDEADILVHSNKTIIGLNGNASLEGIGFKGDKVKNIIIRGFKIRNAHCDAIAFRQSHHIWIDHCDLASCDDGLLDLTLGSDLMTVSWTRFADHNKTSICNSGTQHDEDIGKQRVSYHHNAFFRTTQRNPRIGYGRGHLWNNYYEEIRSYCIGFFDGARLLLENNYFKDSKKPFNQMYVSDPNNIHFGHALERNNIFDNCKNVMDCSGKAFDTAEYYDYSLALDSTNTIAAIVKDAAGTAKGLEYDLVPIPNSGKRFLSNLYPLLQWSKAPGAKRYIIYLSETLEVLTNQTSASHKKCQIGRTNKNALKVKSELKPNTTYYWRVDTELKDRTIQGHIWQFTTAE